MTLKNVSLFSWALVAGLGLLFALSLGSFLYGNYQAGDSAAQAGDSAAWQMVINGLILSIPLALFYFSIGVLVVAARQKYGQGHLHPRLARLIYWSPRIAGIAIIFFVSLFALDVFSEGYSLRTMLLGFLMHLLPSIGLVVVLVLAWRWEWIGFIAFLGAALYFLRFVLGNSIYGWSNLLLFSAPLLVIALLFGANWRWHQELHPANP